MNSTNEVKPFGYALKHLSDGEVVTTEYLGIDDMRVKHPVFTLTQGMAHVIAFNEEYKDNEYELIPLCADPSAMPQTDEYPRELGDEKTLAACPHVMEAIIDALSWLDEEKIQAADKADGAGDLYEVLKLMSDFEGDVRVRQSDQHKFIIEYHDGWTRLADKSCANVRWMLQHAFLETDDRGVVTVPGGAAQLIGRSMEKRMDAKSATAK